MSKLRITLFNNESPFSESDRLVESAIEFRNGPKEVHNGPIRIETLLENADDAQGLIDYLSQLTGRLPISEKALKSTIRKSKSSTTLAQDSVDKLLEDIKKKNKDQETLIDYLRSLNFVFVTSDHLKDIFQHNNWDLNFKTEKHERYQFLIRILKLAKDPKNDKYDNQIMFAVKIVGDKYPRVHIYQQGQYTDTLEVHWAEGKEVQFKVKAKFYKFPVPMSYDERHKWRNEDRRRHDDPENFEPTKFFLRWEPHITKLKPLQDKKKQKK